MTKHNLNEASGNHNNKRSTSPNYQTNSTTNQQRISLERSTTPELFYDVLNEFFPDGIPFDQSKTNHRSQDNYRKDKDNQRISLERRPSTPEFFDDFFNAIFFDQSKTNHRSQDNYSKKRKVDPQPLNLRGTQKDKDNQRISLKRRPNNPIKVGLSVFSTSMETTDSLYRKNIIEYFSNNRNHHYETSKIKTNENEKAINDQQDIAIILEHGDVIGNSAIQKHEYSHFIETRQNYQVESTHFIQQVSKNVSNDGTIVILSCHAGISALKVATSTASKKSHEKIIKPGQTALFFGATRKFTTLSSQNMVVFKDIAKHGGKITPESLKEIKNHYPQTFSVVQDSKLTKYSRIKCNQQGEFIRTVSNYTFQYGNKQSGVGKWVIDKSKTETVNLTSKSAPAILESNYSHFTALQQDLSRRDFKEKKTKCINEYKDSVRIIAEAARSGNLKKDAILINESILKNCLDICQHTLEHNSTSHETALNLISFVVTETKDLGLSAKFVDFFNSNAPWLFKDIISNEDYKHRLDLLTKEVNKQCKPDVRGLYDEEDFSWLDDIVLSSNDPKAGKLQNNNFTNGLYLSKVKASVKNAARRGYKGFLNATDLAHDHKKQNISGITHASRSLVKFNKNLFWGREGSKGNLGGRIRENVLNAASDTLKEIGSALNLTNEYDKNGKRIEISKGSHAVRSGVKFAGNLAFNRNPDSTGGRIRANIIHGGSSFGKGVANIFGRETSSGGHGLVRDTMSGMSQNIMKSVGLGSKRGGDVMDMPDGYLTSNFQPYYSSNVLLEKGLSVLFGSTADLERINKQSGIISEINGYPGKHVNDPSMSLLLIFGEDREVRPKYTSTVADTLPKPNSFYQIPTLNYHAPHLVELLDKLENYELFIDESVKERDENGNVVFSKTKDGILIHNNNILGLEKPLEIRITSDQINIYKKRVKEAIQFSYDWLSKVPESDRDVATCESIELLDITLKKPEIELSSFPNTIYKAIYNSYDKFISTSKIDAQGNIDLSRDKYKEFSANCKRELSAAIAVLRECMDLELGIIHKNEGRQEDGMPTLYSFDHKLDFAIGKIKALIRNELMSADEKKELGFWITAFNGAKTHYSQFNQNLVFNYLVAGGYEFDLKKAKKLLDSPYKFTNLLNFSGATSKEVEEYIKHAWQEGCNKKEDNRGDFGDVLNNINNVNNANFTPNNQSAVSKAVFGASHVIYNGVASKVAQVATNASYSSYYSAKSLISKDELFVDQDTKKLIEEESKEYSEEYKRFVAEKDRNSQEYQNGFEKLKEGYNYYNQISMETIAGSIQLISEFKEKFNEIDDKANKAIDKLNEKVTELNKLDAELDTLDKEYKELEKNIEHIYKPLSVSDGHNISESSRSEVTKLQEQLETASNKIEKKYEKFRKVYEEAQTLDKEANKAVHGARYPQSEEDYSAEVRKENLLNRFQMANNIIKGDPEYHNISKYKNSDNQDQSKVVNNKKGEIKPKKSLQIVKKELLKDGTFKILPEALCKLFDDKALEEFEENLKNNYNNLKVCELNKEYKKIGENSTNEFYKNLYKQCKKIGEFKLADSVLRHKFIFKYESTVTPAKKTADEEKDLNEIGALLKNWEAFATDVKQKLDYIVGNYFDEGAYSSAIDGLKDLYKQINSSDYAANGQHEAIRELNSEVIYYIALAYYNNEQYDMAALIAKKSCELYPVEKNISSEKYSSIELLKESLLKITQTNLQKSQELEKISLIRKNKVKALKDMEDFINESLPKSQSNDKIKEVKLGIGKDSYYNVEMINQLLSSIRKIENQILPEDRTAIVADLSSADEKKDEINITAQQLNELIKKDNAKSLIIPFHINENNLQHFLCFKISYKRSEEYGNFITVEVFDSANLPKKIVQQYVNKLQKFVATNFAKSGLDKVKWNTITLDPNQKGAQDGSLYGDCGPHMINNIKSILVNPKATNEEIMSLSERSTSEERMEYGLYLRSTDLITISRENNLIKFNYDDLVKARELYSNEKYDEARDLLMEIRAVSNIPDEHKFEFHYFLGICLTQLEEYESAGAFYEVALESYQYIKNPTGKGLLDCAQRYFDLANTQLEIHQFDEAKEICEKIIKIIGSNENLREVVKQAQELLKKIETIIKNIETNDGNDEEKTNPKNNLSTTKNINVKNQVNSYEELPNTEIIQPTQKTESNQSAQVQPSTPKQVLPSATESTKEKPKTRSKKRVIPSVTELKKVQPRNDIEFRRSESEVADQNYQEREELFDSLLEPHTKLDSEAIDMIIEVIEKEKEKIGCQHFFRFGLKFSNFGLESYKDGENQKAEKCFEKAEEYLNLSIEKLKEPTLERGEELMLAYLQLSYIQFARGRIIEALQSNHAASKVATKNIFDVYERREVLLDYLVANRYSAKLMYDLGVKFYRSNRGFMALSIFQRALEMHNKNPEKNNLTNHELYNIHFLSGNIYLKKENNIFSEETRYAQAVDCYKKAENAYNNYADEDLTEAISKGDQQKIDQINATKNNIFTLLKKTENEHNKKLQKKLDKKPKTSPSKPKASKPGKTNENHRG